MRRAMLVCLIAGAATVVGVPSTALAGAGCHAGATQADATGEKEVMVRIADCSFTPSLTTVDPGTAVTFVNEDWTTHDVRGNEWGSFEDMKEGDAFTATFSESGIYPFACSYHPGMTGAIAVGGGEGAGSGEEVSIQPFEPPAPQTVTRVVTDSGGLSAGPLAVASIVGGLLGAAVTVVLRRSRTMPARVSEPV